MKNSAWTTKTYAIHNEAMRLSDEKFQTERDRRYTEGNELRAMALKIKETADENALQLDRELRTYKEAKNDNMREQNLKETGIYATRDDLAIAFSKADKALIGVVEEMKTTLKPILEHISQDKGSQMTIGKMVTIVLVTGAVMGIIYGLVNLFL